MTPQDTTRDPSAYDASARRGDNRAEPVAANRTRMASDATGINPQDESPIDPRMPNMPPA